MNTPLFTRKKFTLNYAIMRVFANVILVLVSLAALLLWLYSYESFTAMLATWAGLSEKIVKLRESFITFERFWVLRGLMSLTALLSALFRKKLEAFLSRIRESVCATKAILTLYSWRELTFFKHNLRGGEAWLFWSTLIALTSARAFVLSHYPPSLDEAFSFAYLIERGPFVILSYYPGPNNHILYNLLAWPFCTLFSGEIWAQRLPNFFLALLFYPLLFSFLRRNLKSFTLAFILFTLAQLLPQVWYYSAHARGYFFCFVLAFFHLLATWKLESYEKETKHWVYIWVASFALGCFTIPTFVLVGAASFGFVCLNCLSNYQLYSSLEVLKKVKTYLSLSFFSGLCILLFYSPVLLFSELSSLLKNSWVTGSATFWDTLWRYLLAFPMHRLQAEGAAYFFVICLVLLFLLI